MTYYIGQVVSYDPTRDIVGDELTHPAWYALVSLPMKEAALEAALSKRGVHSCFPQHEKTWLVRGKRHRRKFPVISGIVYAKFTTQPQWDILKARKLIRGVYSYGDQPIVLSGDIISAVMGLPTEAEKIEAARREMLRVREGDKAKVCDGPLSDFVVDVRTVKEGRVWWETITGIKGSTAVDKIERVVPHVV